ncbi:MAG TPA: hypothetical protein VF616_04510 [Duganella sp.]|uniref:hypothetical protein n=1 Tax=Duganella sp. TaxID=1904440 RepID=UPI002ED2FC59
MRTVLNRLYSDYLMPSRLRHYEALLRQARQHGYRQTSVRAWLATLRGGRAGDGPVLVHRHDIDTDLPTARRMFALEQKHGVRASYYFRLSTLDFDLMRDIEDYGSEASYHYEEIATYAKQAHLKDAAQVRLHMGEIRDQFERNFRHIEQQLGIKMVTVASHGDFANRRLGMINHELLDDAALRARCGIDCESYDDELLSSFDIYISDRPHPEYFHPLPPQAALGKHRRICLLTHPSQWRTNWVDSSRHNLRRLVEAWRW